MEKYYSSSYSNSNDGHTSSNEVRNFIILVVVLGIIGLIYYANRGDIYSSVTPPNQLQEPIPNDLTNTTPITTPSLITPVSNETITPTTGNPSATRIKPNTISANTHAVNGGVETAYIY